MTLGERIVSIRKEKKLSQKALAEKMGISATRLNYWEKDKREPDVQMINMLCAALGVDGDTLLGRKNKTSPGLDGPKDADELDIMRYVAGLTADQLEILIAVLQVMTEQNQRGLSSALGSDGEQGQE